MKNQYCKISKCYNQCEKCGHNAYINEQVKKIRKEAIDECKNIVIQTLDNEGLADTLLLRMENLKGEK